MRTILHIDMDAFFAAVEQRDDPRLRGKPVLVGGAARRGVVAAASYEARRYGCHSAMPMAEAIRKCPRAIVVPPRGERYAEVSEQVFAIFHRYTPLVEGLSIDEAFLDVSESRSLFGDGEAIAKAIRAEVQETTALTCSAGVAPCKFVAKLASDMNKPDGLTVAPFGPKELEAFLAPLPIERMWGIGQKTAPTLRSLGLRTLGDLARADPKQLETVLGTWGSEIRLLARGIDAREVEPERAAKSIGAESTYEHDLTDRESIARSLLAHAQRVAGRLTEGGLVANVVVVKLKYSDFTLLTRRKVLDEPASDTKTIHDTAVALLDRFPLSNPRVRLTGVLVQNLLGRDGKPQQALFPDAAKDRRTELEGVLLRAKDRFGGAAITRASLMDEPSPRTAPEGNLEAVPRPRANPRSN